MEKAVVVPGDVVVSNKEGRSGVGAFSLKGDIRASIVGALVLEQPSTGNKKRVNVITNGQIMAKDLVLTVGDIVYGKVTKTNYNQAFVDILFAGDHELPFVTKAVVRREDIRETEVDKVVVHDFFAAGDVVRAAVLSLGDNKQYFLSVAKPGLGVVVPHGHEPEI
jgi:exosome complex component CSL4